MKTSLRGVERNALTAALLALFEEISFEQLTIREITAGTGYPLVEDTGERGAGRRGAAQT
ncbi:hypothetical protein V474_21570 [Novosphingobium barchaimii LL02]|uniref:HTH tetR-type domain-containing protein n=1 Tax=Novosphingobium barchaimii LL02 TaxID=1114963 RepID=A0A0J7XRE3_9SPHN|nr:hypothetical protein [Novosphingobium barchaimii]KMS54446.1 hypothetical protein V474_21570 [Novosphingobium barchaimii LL02]